jgi:hypothetical protein
MPSLNEAAILRAHQYLMRGRAGLCAFAAALACSVASSVWYPAATYLLLGAASVIFMVSLGLLAIAGNAVGRFGPKYVFAVIIGGPALALTLTSFAALAAPVAAFFWAKHDVGTAFRALKGSATGGLS